MLLWFFDAVWINLYLTVVQESILWPKLRKGILPFFQQPLLGEFAVYFRVIELVDELSHFLQRPLEIASKQILIKILDLLHKMLNQILSMKVRERLNFYMFSFL